MAHDMQALGCLIVELFQSSRLRVLVPNAPLVDRYRLIRKIYSKVKDELPRYVPVPSSALVYLRYTLSLIILCIFFAAYNLHNWILLSHRIEH